MLVALISLYNLMLFTGWAYSGTDEFQRRLQQQFYEYADLEGVQIRDPSN